MPNLLFRYCVLFTAALSACVLTSCDGDGGGGGGGNETITLALATNQPCYGIRIDVDGATDGEVFCDADPLLTELGCTTDVDVNANRTSLSVGGCFAENQTPLFTCSVPSHLANKFLTAAQVHCGCGCAANCPTSPSVSACDVEKDLCTSPDGEVLDPGSEVSPPQRSSSPSHRVAVTSSTDACGGLYCDAVGEANVSLASGQGLRELEFDLRLALDGGCACSLEDCTFSSSLAGPVTLESVETNIVHVCIADDIGLDATRFLLGCSYSSGGDSFSVANVTALTADLRPADPPPVLLREEQ